jgi:hypothetical protein
MAWTAARRASKRLRRSLPGRSPRPRRRYAETATRLEKLGSAPARRADALVVAGGRGGDQGRRCRGSAPISRRTDRAARAPRRLWISPHRGGRSAGSTAGVPPSFKWGEIDALPHEEADLRRESARGRTSRRWKRRAPSRSVRSAIGAGVARYQLRDRDGRADRSAARSPLASRLLDR